MSQRVYKVDSRELAVLPKGFSRELLEPWVNTSVPNSCGVLGGLGPRLGLKGSCFLSFCPTFDRLLGREAKLELLASKDHPFAHEGPVYLPQSDEVFFVSDRLGDRSTANQCVDLWAVNVSTGDLRQIHTNPQIPLANGAVRYRDGIVLLAQGHTSDTNNDPGGVIYLNPFTGEWQWLLNNFFGLHFNSPNDVVTTRNGAIWFTDPTYASNQGFKGTPQSGEFVWRFEPGGRPARVVADGFVRPNGLALSSNESTLYVSDTGMLSGAETSEPDPAQPRTIYAFDIVELHGGQFLVNRRVFAICDCGIPDGLKCDAHGNVYAGCGDGIQVWAPSGDLIGKIVVEGGVDNFVFAGPKHDLLVMLSKTKVFKLRVCTSSDSR